MLKLNTFHYSNACGLVENENSQLLFDVIEGKMGNFSFKTDNYEWVGPSGAPTEKIDGMVALIMAWGRAMFGNDDTRSVYETRGIICL